MTTPRRIASFVGPIVIVIAASEAMNVGIWATGMAPLTYLAGLAWFIGGLAILRVHDRWSTGWPVSITIVGWFFLLGGLFRVFFPAAQQGNQNTPTVGIYAVDIVLFVLGAVMTVNALRRDRPSEEPA